MCVDLEACGNDARANFTIIHEAGHSQFDMKVIPDVLENKTVIQDTYLMIGGTLFKVKSRSSKDWMEHHADKYATFILITKKFVSNLLLFCLLKIKQLKHQKKCKNYVKQPISIV